MTEFEPITSYEALAPELDALLKQKIVANYAPERQALEAEIAAGLLWAGRLPQGLVLLRRGGGPQRLRFLLTEPQALCGLVLDRSTALELPFRSGDTRFPQLARDLEGSGWAEALRRVRLSRRPGPRPSAQGAASPLLRPADEISDPASLLRLLRCCFSPLTGCLPEQAELQADLAAGRVLALPGGLIRWREKGRSSEIRHLAVAPAQRGQGLAKALVGAYLDRAGDRLCRVWTAGDNLPARRVYEGFGYAPDGWESIVLIHSRPDMNTSINPWED